MLSAEMQNGGELGEPARAHLSATHALVVVTVYGVSPTPHTHFAPKPHKVIEPIAIVS